MDTMQSAADSMHAGIVSLQQLVMTITKVRYWHLFTTTIMFRAASIVLHNFTGINVPLIYDQIRMVEWIDDSRFNKPIMFVQR